MRTLNLLLAACLSLAPLTTAATAKQIPNTSWNVEYVDDDEKTNAAWKEDYRQALAVLEKMVLPVIYNSLTPAEKQASNGTTFIAYFDGPAVPIRTLPGKRIQFGNMFTMLGAAILGGTTGTFLGRPEDVSKYYQYIYSYYNDNPEADKPPPLQFFDFIGVTEAKQQQAIIRDAMNGAIDPDLEFSQSIVYTTAISMHAAVAFLISHELAHIINDDLHQSTLSYEKLEYRADKFAIEILSRNNIEPGASQTPIFLHAAREDLENGKREHVGSGHDFADCRWWAIEYPLQNERVEKAKRAIPKDLKPMSREQAEKVINLLTVAGEKLMLQGTTTGQADLINYMRKEFGKDADLEAYTKLALFHFLESEREAFISAKSHIVPNCHF